MLYVEQFAWSTDFARSLPGLKLSDGLGKRRSKGPSCYTGGMIDEVQFRNAADEAIQDLTQELYAKEDEGGFEVEENAGALYVIFEKPAGKFVITPNAPVQQIWISARNTSFKLDLTTDGFVLAKTGELLTPLVLRLIEAHLTYS
jgi:CyaY protein